MKKWIKDLSMQAQAEHKCYYYYQEIFTGWKLGKGARDRHMTLYRQYTDVAKMVQVADGARQAFWTLLRKGSFKAVT